MEIVKGVVSRNNQELHQDSYFAKKFYDNNVLGEFNFDEEI